MKRIFSFFSLLGIVSLSCGSLSPNPKPKVTETVGSGQTTIMQDGVPVQEFSLDNVNSVSPDDVFIEVTYMGHGGPGDTGYCRDSDSNPISYPEPLIVEDPEDNELMIRSMLATCGWQKNQNLDGTIIYPDGRIKTYQFVADDAGAAVLSFAPNLDDPDGVYTYKIASNEYSLESNAYFYTPNVPRLYYLNENQIQFHNFPPGELVQLVMFADYSGYDQQADGGMNFVIGDTGKLIVNLPIAPNALFVGVAFGLDFIPIDNVDTSHNRLLSRYTEITGLHLTDGYFERLSAFTEKTESYRSCRQDIESDFLPFDVRQVGDHYVSVLTSEVNLYHESRNTARTKQSLKVGQPLKLVNGPYCFDKSIWWSVLIPEFYTNNGFKRNYSSGYVAEVNWQNERQLDKQSCGSIPSRLSYLEYAFVAFSNGNNKRIRQQPGFSADILTTVPEGTNIRIVSERWCMDNTPWWLVTDYGNINGWMTEIQDGIYFLEPAPK